MKITSIALITHDSDFSNTFSHLMETIKEVIIANPDISTETIEKIIKEGLRFHYIAFQNRYEYVNTSETFDCHFDFIEKYLKLTYRIFFNKEADELAVSNDYFDGAWYFSIYSDEITWF